VVSRYTTGDRAHTIELVYGVGGGPAGVAGIAATMHSGPLAAETLGDVDGPGHLAMAVGADDGVLVRASESDGDGVLEDMPGNGGDCDGSYDVATALPAP